METVGWNGRRRLTALIAICAAVVVIEAIALVAAGGNGRRGAVVKVGSGPVAVPFQAPRSVPSPGPVTPPTTSAPALPSVQEVVATLPVVRQASMPTPAVNTAATPTPTTQPAKPAVTPVAPPPPACTASDVTVTVTTDKVSYSQHDTVNATAVIRNVSGHDCSAPSYSDTTWCDGGSTCISAAGPIDPTKAPGVWPAGGTQTASDSWAFGQGDHPFTPQPGHGKVTFTWHLADDGSQAAGTATFTIVGPPATTTTSSTEAPTTSTTIAP